MTTTVTVELLHAHNRKLAARVEELEEELRQCKEMMTFSTSLPSWVPHLFPIEEAVLRHLMARDQVTHDSIFYMLYGTDTAAPGAQMSRVWIFKLRKKLRPFGIVIETLWGSGYRLPAQFRKLLSDPLAPCPALLSHPNTESDSDHQGNAVGQGAYGA